MANMRTTPRADQAAVIRRCAEKYGLTVTAKIKQDFNGRTRQWDGKAIDANITVETRFTPGDRQAYMLAEGRCLEILRMFRQVRGGSTWGTTSDGVGGHAGLAEGRCRINKSGIEISMARLFAQEATNAR
jgi:hypothetical protein